MTAGPRRLRTPEHGDHTDLSEEHHVAEHGMDGTEHAEGTAGASAAEAGIESLAEQECWELLRQAAIGRLAVWVDDHPEIFPVNFVVDHGALVFRSAPGTKVTAALATAAVALETDARDAEAGTAWSVVVKGRAEQITDTSGLMDTVRLRLVPWQGGEKGRFIRIVPTEVTGRRFPIVSPEWWREPLGEVPRAAEE